MDTPVVLMDRERIYRSAKRMVYEIIEQNSSNKPVMLFGIDRRGHVVAQLLASILEDISGSRVRTFQLPVSTGMPGQDFSNLGKNDFENSLPVIVDDVIFSGQTMFKALEKVSAKGDPSEIHTAVMIDRGHRKLPIKAEYYGMELPTKHNEHVSVIVDDGEIKLIELEKV